MLLQRFYGEVSVLQVFLQHLQGGGVDVQQRGLGAALGAQGVAEGGYALQLGRDAGGADVGFGPGACGAAQAFGVGAG